MKFNYLFLTLALIGASVLPIKALAEEVETPKEEKKEIGLSLEVGSDLVSSYLWLEGIVCIWLGEYRC